jgi:hypothetical protein
MGRDVACAAVEAPAAVIGVCPVVIGVGLLGEDCIHGLFALALLLTLAGEPGALCPPLSKLLSDSIEMSRVMSEKDSTELDRLSDVDIPVRLSKGLGTIDFLRDDVEKVLMVRLTVPV